MVSSVEGATEQAVARDYRQYESHLPDVSGILELELVLLDFVVQRPIPSGDAFL